MRSDASLGTTLLQRSHEFRALLTDQGVDVPADDSQIIPIMIGENAHAVRVMNALLEDGILLAAVRPPSVPEGTARLRISVTLAHQSGDLEHAAQKIARALQPSGAHS
jgi:7-keto-8-aminopelargonate synthetase-like enzyme